MKIRTLLGLAAVGGVAYAHNKRGGEWTIEGLKETLRQLYSGVQDKLQEFAEQAKQELEHQQEKDVTPQAGESSTGYPTGDITGYPR